MYCTCTAPAVTRYNLEVLGMCPCLVDIEIVDTRNGNESNLVTAGQEACACDDPGRKVGVGLSGPGGREWQVTAGRMLCC